MNRSLGKLLAVGAGLLLATGCGSSAPHAAAKPGRSGPVVAASAGHDSGTAVITVQGLGFGTPLTVNPGEPIVVINRDEVPHMVMSGAAFTVSVAANGKTTFSAPTVPGSYPLSGDTPAMHGMLNVRGV